MAAANSEYTHSRVNAMMTVPIITDSTMLPPGKMAGACRSRKTDPTATFMPSVFMISASHIDTSRTRPVALRVKLKSCGSCRGCGCRCHTDHFLRACPAVAGTGGNGGASEAGPMTCLSSPPTRWLSSENLNRSARYSTRDTSVARSS